jgi:hypothetical protein
VSLILSERGVVRLLLLRDEAAWTWKLEHGWFVPDVLLCSGAVSFRTRGGKLQDPERPS